MTYRQELEEIGISAQGAQGEEQEKRRAKRALHGIFVSKKLLPFVTFDEIALKFVLENRAEVLKIRNIWNDVPTM